MNKILITLYSFILLLLVPMTVKASDRPLLVGDVFESENLRYEVISTIPYDNVVGNVRVIGRSQEDNVYKYSDEFHIFSLAQHISMSNGSEYSSYYKVTAIAPGAFKGDKNIESLSIHAPIKTIPANMCKNCKKLNSVTIDNIELTKIEKNAFANCKSLSKISILSRNIKKIEKNAFKGTHLGFDVAPYKNTQNKIKKLVKKSGLPEKSFSVYSSYKKRWYKSWYYNYQHGTLA